VSRGAFLAALLLAIGPLRGATAQVVSPPSPPPGDTSSGRDTTRADSTRDTLPHYLPVLPAAIPEGPLPRGSRYTFTTDSFAFSDTKTLADLLAHIPGVYVARGGPYGQAEAVLYGGRGPPALEVYWDGVPYLPLGRDSVYLDPARIPLSPLERVDVIVLPAMLRVYLVTARQSSSAPTSEVGITTGVFSTGGYRGTFLKRWRSGIGLSLVADWNDINDASGSGTTAFHDVDLWLKGEYVPSPRVGASFQIVSTDWDRSGTTDPLVNPFHSKRVSDLARLFVALRPDGFGPRLDLTLATTATSRDTAVADRSFQQLNLELSSLWPRASAGLIARLQSDPIPFELEARAAWNPVFPLTLAVDARHAGYALGKSGDRAHFAGSLDLPLGFSARGDVAWGNDLDAPARADDSVQTTNDLFGAIRWQSRWATLEVGGARRDAFAPLSGFPAGLLTVSALAPTPATNYLSIQASLRPVPGLTLSGWYFDPVRGGGEFEPPKHARYALTFYSKFWRTYRSGIFALRAEAAAESWTGGAGAGVVRGPTTPTVPLTLAGATFIDLNVEIRIAGVTIFWANRNARAFRGGYVPGTSYPSTYQSYGVRWRFTN
jgi:hypothetical protein